MPAISTFSPIEGTPTLGGVSALVFSDLFLEPDGRAWFKTSPDDRERRALSDEALEDALTLRSRLQEHQTGMDFRTEWRGARLRVQRIETVDGDVYICRRLADGPLPIEKLGYPPSLVKALTGEAMSKSGLVLFTGSTGSGKSTSLSSVLASRLHLFGGTAWTVENPVETALHGQHGAGTCYQTEVTNDGEFGLAIQRMLRAAPNIIMIGEIRNAEAAAQAVLAGTSGHMVMTTLHANDIQSALERIKNMIGRQGLDAAFLADAIGAVIHQSMSVVRLNDTVRRTMNVTPLLITGSRNSTAIRAHLRSGEFSQLSSEIERQRRLLMTAGAEGVF